MNKVIPLATLLVASLFVFAEGDKGHEAEEEIRRLNEQEVKALLRNDAATLEHLWSDDFVVTNPFNKFIDKRQVLAMTQSGTLAFTSYDRQVDYVRVYNDTAVVAGGETVVWAGTLPTAGQTSRLRFTGIWMKQGGRWQEVARHANMVVQR
ncbi:MAG: nuclear transport factor 2 family protein [Acidobacteriota bacterium]